MSGKKSAPRSGASSRALAKAFSHDDPNLEGPGSSSYDRALDHKDSRKGKSRDRDELADLPRPPSPPQLPTSSSKGKGHSSRSVPKHLRSEDPNREGPDSGAWDRALDSKDQRKAYTPSRSAFNRSPSPERPSGGSASRSGGSASRSGGSASRSGGSAPRSEFSRQALSRALTDEDANLEGPNSNLYGRGLGHHRKDGKGREP